MSAKKIHHLFCIALILMFALGTACSPAKQHNKYLTAEDEAVMELLDAIKRNPNDKELLSAFPDRYAQSMDSRERNKEYVLRDNPPGDRWALWSKQLEASAYITQEVMKVPQAAALIRLPRFYTAEIEEAKSNAASEYYNQGLEYLMYNNRPYAQQALDMFQKANKIKPGYLDVARKIEEATLLSQMVVMVNPVDYYNYGWNHWGLNNDYLQWQMVNDLNRQSWRNVRFYTPEDVRRLRLHPERIVELRFMRLDVYSPFQERNQYERTAMVPVAGGSRPDSTKPAMQQVRATVYITRRTIRGEADLFCNVYDQVVNRSVFTDHFPGRYQWEERTASFTGDRRALTDEDLRLLNNRFSSDPTRNDIARKLIEDSYQRLISRIQQAVNFGTN